MNGKDIELSRRRVIVSIVVIGLAAAAAGAGTFAAFSDTEASNNNNVQAGTLDLTIDGTNSSVQLLNVTNAVPGGTGNYSTNLTNNGDVDGNLNLTLSVSSAENGVNDPESDVDDENIVELNQSALNVTAGIDTNQNGAIDNGEWSVTGSPADIQDTHTNAGTLHGGDSANLIVQYEISPSAGNEIQSDRVTIDATIELTQAN